MAENNPPPISSEPAGTSPKKAPNDLDGLDWMPSNLSAVHVQPNNQFETVGLLDTEADVSGVSTAANAPQAVEAEGQPSGFCGCCTLAYYKPLFNVDSSDVSTRLLASLLPFKETKFFETVGDTADLYGPFWISATLVFVIGAAANLNSWAKTPSDKAHQWTYDFRMLTAAGGIVFGFLVGASVILWACLQYVSVAVPLRKLLCLYGYSLTIFVPAAFLCITPSNATDWFVVAYAIGTSASLLIVNLYPIVKEKAPASSVIMSGILIGSQVVFALVMKLYFFGLLAP